MWVNPNHPDPPAAAAPPREQGERIACFDRPKGEQLRVTLETYNGHPFVRLAVWAVGSDGQVWPLKGKQVTVKLRELAPLAGALAKLAADQAETAPAAAPRRDDRPKFIDKGRPVRPPWEAEALPQAGGHATGFDEFKSD